MAGTRAGGLKAAAKNKEKYGEGFYQRIGQKGGMLGHTGGFFANPELARLAGAKGGRRSKRGPNRMTMKIVKEGKEMTKIFIKRINTEAQEIKVNYGSNKL